MTDMKILVKPVAGSRMKNPRNGRVLPPEGEFLAASSFWRRAAADGDVVLSAPPSPKRRADKGGGVD